MTCTCLLARAYEAETAAVDAEEAHRGKYPGEYTGYDPNAPDDEADCHARDQKREEADDAWQATKEAYVTLMLRNAGWRPEEMAEKLRNPETHLMHIWVIDVAARYKHLIDKVLWLLNHTRTAYRDALTVDSPDKFEEARELVTQFEAVLERVVTRPLW